MKKSVPAMTFALMLACGVCHAQAPGPSAKTRPSFVSLLGLTATPGIEYPIELGKNLLDLGGTIELRGGIPLPFLPWLSAGLGLTYSFLPVRAETSLSFLSACAQLRAAWEPLPRLTAFATLGGGGYYGFFNKTMIDVTGTAFPGQQGGSASYSADLGCELYLAPTVSLGLRAGYTGYVGFGGSLRAGIGTSFHLDGLTRRVEASAVEVRDLFPSLYPTYQAHPPGRATITNRERFPLEGITVTTFVKEYMDKPTLCDAPRRLRPGESADVELGMLLSGRVLDLAEATRLNAEVRVDYTLNGRRGSLTTTHAVRLHNRNALTWDDDRKAAAFLSVTDPEVLGFSKGIAGVVREKGPKSVNLALRMGIGMFSALSTYGISYVVDPNTPSYSEASKAVTNVDFLQFPRQTLAYKGGDCDDLSILYCTLLESVGVETAMITVPGHIYSAFALDMGPEEAKAAFSAASSFVVEGGRAWVPVETTLIGSGFVEAWEAGARQWKDASAKGAAKLLPTHESWKLYESAGAPSDPVQLKIPGQPALAAAYSRALDLLVRRELAPKVAELQKSIATGSSREKDLNRLGVLYAQYGLVQEAERQFTKALAQSEYVPAMLNLANLHFLAGAFDKALALLGRAAKASPDNPKTALLLAQVHFGIGNPALSASYYAKAVRGLPEIADKFSYLAAAKAPEENARAGDASRAGEVVSWNLPE